MKATTTRRAGTRRHDPSNHLAVYDGTDIPECVEAPAADDDKPA